MTRAAQWYGNRRADFGTLLAARLAALLGTAGGVRILTELVSPRVFGEFRLAVGLGTLAVLTLAAPYNRYSMRGYHDTPTCESGLEFLGAGRSATTYYYGAWAGVLVLAGAVVATAQGDIKLAWLGAGAALYFLSESALGFEMGTLITTEHIKTAAIVDAAKGLGLPVAAVAAFLLVGESSASLVFGQVVMLGLVLIFTRRQIPVGQASESRKGWLEAGWSFAAPLMWVGLLGWLFSQSDRYILAAMRSTTDVGLYAVAYGIAAAPVLVLGAIIPTLVYAPTVRAAGEARTSAFRLAERSAIVTQASLVVAVVASIIVLAPVGVAMLLSDEYRNGAVPIVRWVAVGHGFQVFAYVLDVGSYARRRTSSMALALSAAVVTNVGLNILWIPSNGGLGAAWATAAGGIVYAGVLGIVNRMTGVRTSGAPDS